MSNIGYYRYKFTPTTEGRSEVEVYINGALVSTHVVYAKEFCSNFKILKYIDRCGRYRFFPFNDKWQIKNAVSTKGTILNFVTSIKDSQTDAFQLGYKNVRTLSLTAGNVSSDELDKLADIYSSPRVYLYVGEGVTDEVNDWVLVTITGDGISRRKKDKHAKVNIEVTLPETYSISLL